MMVDVTDATFADEVLAESETTPVVVDLWAPWCGPCRQLGPVLDAAIAAKDGAVKGVKVNVDENPAVAGAFGVQSIPAVYAMRRGAIVDGFLGARGAAEVEQFLDRVADTHGRDPEVADGESADSASERDASEGISSDPVSDADLESRPKGDPAGEADTAFTNDTNASVEVPADVEEQLDALLGRVKLDESARERFVDLLDALGRDDPRTAVWRRRLTATLF